MTDDRCDLLCLDAPAAERIRSALPSHDEMALLAATAQACSDATRLKMLIALLDGSELCVCDLTWILSKPQNLVSHHLRKLREAGLVVPRRQSKIVFYSLTEAGRAAITAMLQMQSAGAR